MFVLCWCMYVYYMQQGKYFISICYRPLKVRMQYVETFQNSLNVETILCLTLSDSV